ncbi:nitroreductase family protein [Acidiferrobacter thiooxydans]|jgi:nitroreductase|uniref:Nitroreductase family protein n=1 Tax=Acidiferrobacter thiooxydans TaxID=163359 RepID=A0A1C2G4M6_9GAMM|nr:nitroreductase family protein [Acidiferrobacter thiooxydans]MDA8118784.1 nitroreductase family protein [Gammaproteobacteria bacterium]MDA8191486.1 nitroreductase family protein [Gammaproteobacteria bacterium]RCN56652.1 nitroreductase family protein [Acidiferrobacter thiooxydans]UEN99322.1 nitroreductase family protein [Acidiferrobacter thiooxydans]
MDIVTAIKARRAVKQFDPSHRLTESEVDTLLSLAMLSPTAFNIQHWRFVLVQDPQLRDAIRAASWMQSQITDASLLIVMCADLKAWEKQPERYWRNAPADVREGILAAIDAYYRGRETVQRDEAMRSCGIAAQTLMLAAQALGYDSCPMDLADFGEVGRLIGLPEDHVIGLFVAIGRGVREPRPRAGALTRDEVVRKDRF